VECFKDLKHLYRQKIRRSVVIKRYQVILLSILLLPISAYAADNQCLDKTCVDVFTQDNQLIIIAQKGAGKPVAASKKPIVKPKPVTPKPVAPKPVAPNPKVEAKPVPKPTVKPVRKVATKPATVSLSDRLIKLLPLGDINFQPESDGLVNVPVYFWTQTPQHFSAVVPILDLVGDGLVNVPVYFWTQTPQHFSAVVPILDLVVYVNLHSTFTWSFGDGSFYTTTNQGGPYPLGLITHTYRKNSNYPVGLKVVWRGSWSVNGVTTPISGEAITQSVSRQISIVNAVGRFTK